jgi:hypothetical protein
MTAWEALGRCKHSFAKEIYLKGNRGYISDSSSYIIPG